jgi:hypothetical protein
MDDIKIELPICNQYDATHDPQWANRICAICSIWMLIKLNDPSFSRSAMELTHELKEAGGYLENIGWKHASLVELAGKYGLTLQYARKFFYSPEEKELGAKIIAENLYHRHPVIVSVFHHMNPAKGGHMVIIQGFQEFNGQTIGYYIQDPDASYRGHNYFLTKDEFFAGWRGGMIYQDSVE